MPPTRPGPPRHDPAWFTCIPPRSLCACGHNDARVDDAAPRADQHLTPSSKPESKPNPAPDGLLPAHRCPPGQLLHAPQTRAKTENPIGQYPRPAASCFGGYRTPAGARFPSQTRSLSLYAQDPETRRSSHNQIPVFHVRQAISGKTQLGTQTVRELAVTWARTSFVKRWSWAQIFLSYCRGGALVALWWLQGEAIERCAADLASLIRPVRP